MSHLHEEKFRVTETHIVTFPWSKNGEYMVCVHLTKAAQNPVKGPEMPTEVKLTVEAMTQMGMMPHAKPQHITAEANLMLTPEEYRGYGNPGPGDTVRVEFYFGERT